MKNDDMRNLIRIPAFLLVGLYCLYKGYLGLSNDTNFIAWFLAAIFYCGWSILSILARFMTRRPATLKPYKEIVLTFPNTHSSDLAQEPANKLLYLIMKTISEKHNKPSPETLLSAIGGLAGFTSQMSVREYYMDNQGATEQEIFTIIGTKNNKTFYSNAGVNNFLSKEEGDFIGLLSRIKAVLKHRFCIEKSPDVHAIISKVASRMGSDSYGELELPSDRVLDIPLYESLCICWKEVNTYFVNNSIELSQRPHVLAFVAQKSMIACEKEVELELSARIILESAAYMAKIDPKEIVNK